MLVAEGVEEAVHAFLVEGVGQLDWDFPVRFSVALQPPSVEPKFTRVVNTLEIVLSLPPYSG